ncbi:MAG: glycosyltransferase [Ruminococcus sp.]|nr:glycosyltransferase [Ruminococcus sp.]
MEKIIVMLSSYNGEKYIRTQIDSILNQKMDAELQLIIRDDGSTDDTLLILDEYTKAFNNVTVLKGNNIGYIASFFTLLKVAPKADYYSFSDQDDFWLSDKLQVAIDKLKKAKSRYPQTPLLYGSSSFLVNDDLIVYGETQKKIRKISLFNTIIQNFLPGHSQVMNSELRDVINAVNIDYAKIYVHDSFITNIALLSGRIVFDNESHTLYRQTESNTLGYGVGTINWVKERIRRINKQDGQCYALQMKYICKTYRRYLPREFSDEMRRFFKSQKSFISRLTYIFKTELYRQKKVETLLFKMLYLKGGYNITDSTM